MQNGQMEERQDNGLNGVGIQIRDKIKDKAFPHNNQIGHLIMPGKKKVQDWKRLVLAVTTSPN